jgi:hypothetical protein
MGTGVVQQYRSSTCVQGYRCTIGVQVLYRTSGLIQVFMGPRVVQGTVVKE